MKNEIRMRGALKNAMFSIGSAKFRRLTHKDGITSAEVEVVPAHAGDPGLLAYFTTEEAEAGDFRLVQVVRNDADFEVDWYDNNMHQAYEELRHTALQSGSFVPAATSWEPEQLKRDVLAFGDIRQQLQAHLR